MRIRESHRIKYLVLLIKRNPEYSIRELAERTHLSYGFITKMKRWIMSLKKKVQKSKALYINSTIFRANKIQDLYGEYKAITERMEKIKRNSVKYNELLIEQLLTRLEIELVWKVVKK